MSTAAYTGGTHYVTRQGVVEEVTKLINSDTCLNQMPRSVHCRGAVDCDLDLADGSAVSVARASNGGRANGDHRDVGNTSLDTAAAAYKPVLVCHGQARHQGGPW